MNEEFNRRQLEAEKHEQASQSSHSTMETYQIEQHEANAGHFTPGPSGEQHTTETAPPPRLWQRIKKILGMF